MKPDYGMYLVRSGVSKDISQSFYDFPIDHLARVDRDIISTMKVIERDGNEFAVSFDVPKELFQELVMLFPKEDHPRLSEWISNPALLHPEIEFDLPVRVKCINAILGDKQIGQSGEHFIPFLVQSFALTEEIDSTDNDEEFELKDDNEGFNFTDDDYYAIEIADNVARRLLKHSNILPQQVVGIGNALYALERFPDVTPGAFAEFGICYVEGDEDMRVRKYINFMISESKFEIYIGGSLYNKSVGGDSFSEPGWIVEVGGFREGGCSLCDLESSIEEYLNLGAKIVVSDESEIEYE